MKHAFLTFNLLTNSSNTYIPYKLVEYVPCYDLMSSRQHNRVVSSGLYCDTNQCATTVVLKWNLVAHHLYEIYNTCKTYINAQLRKMCLHYYYCYGKSPESINTVGKCFFLVYIVNS